MIPAWSSAYVGIPYEPHGRGPDRFDCWGFVRHIYQKQFDITLPAFDALYVDEAEIQDALAIARDEETPYFPVEQSEIQEGDLVLFASIRDVLHIAIIMDHKSFIHLNSHVGTSTIERIDAPIWRNRIIGIYRHKEIHLSTEEN